MLCELPGFRVNAFVDQYFPGCRLGLGGACVEGFGRLAEAFHRTAEGLGLDALLAPQRAPLLVFGTRRVEIFLMLAFRIAEPIQKRAVVL